MMIKSLMKTLALASNNNWPTLIISKRIYIYYKFLHKSFYLLFFCHTPCIYSRHLFMCNRVCNYFLNSNKFINVYGSKFINVYGSRFINVFDIKFINVYGSKFIYVYGSKFINVYGSKFINVYL